MSPIGFKAYLSALSNYGTEFKANFQSYSPQTTLDPLQAALNPITLAPPAADLQAPATQEAQVYQEGLDILPFHLFRPHAVRPGIGFHVFITPRSSGSCAN